jgi:hypothetical protein
LRIRRRISRTLAVVASAMDGRRRHRKSSALNGRRRWTGPSRSAKWLRESPSDRRIRRVRFGGMRESEESDEKVETRGSD